MLDVFFTVDVEVWCGSWQNLDQRFPLAYQQYIYGPTAKGDYGLPFQLKVLNDHDLSGIFFVEPLFATRFGIAPLEEIVGLIRNSNQEVQLHLHTEWVDESTVPLLDNTAEKRQHLRYFSMAEQEKLIGAGIDLVKRAGASDISAFRAGSFAFNLDTLRALAVNNIRYDSSYNASLFGPDSGVLPGVCVVSPVTCEGVHEYPMSVFNDGTGSLRHVQLTACSSKEMESMLWQALDDQRQAFVLLSHSFELLNQARNRPDNVVVKRFLKLCDFLDRNRDCFSTRGFNDLAPGTELTQPEPLTSPIWRTGSRMVEQAMRKRFG